MEKIIDLEDWLFDETFPADKRFVDADIHFKYTDTNTVLDFSPAERKKKINEDHKEKYKKLLDTGLFKEYRLIGTAQSPRGLKAKVPYECLEIIKTFDFVRSISINRLDGAKKKTKRRDLPSYYCVKMTVAVEIEGVDKGMQTIEDRFVIVKAKSHDEAIKNLEKTKNVYSEPYLNSDGRLVRFKVESFDDSYETEIHGMADLNNPEGVEVFSKFRSRRLKDGNVWNGRSDNIGESSN